MAVSEQYATFHVGSLYFGIEVAMVQEILRYQPLTKVPLSAPEVRGLINLRGQILTAIDLRKRLSLGEERRPSDPMNMVVRTGDGVVILLVDRIGDVIEVTNEQREDTPETLRPSLKEVIRGVFKLDSSLMLVLDAEKATHIDHVQ